MYNNHAMMIELIANLLGYKRSTTERTEDERTETTTIPAGLSELGWNVERLRHQQLQLWHMPQRPRCLCILPASIAATARDPEMRGVQSRLSWERDNLIAKPLGYGIEPQSRRAR